MIKKCIALLFIFISLITAASPSVTAQQDGDDATMLIDVLADGNRDKIEEYLDSGLFDESMNQVDLNKPILLVYNVHYAAYAKDHTFEENLEYLYENGDTYLLLFDEEPVFIGRGETNVRVREIADVFGTIPSFIYDIANGTASQSFLGEEAMIRNVYCFNALTQHQGVALVFETDSGRFVRYYEDEHASAVEFSWEDYQQYAAGYFAYSTSFDNNYTFFGAGKGGTVSFLEYVKDPSQYIPTNTPAIVAGVAVGLLAVAAAVTVFLKKKRKLNQKA